MLDKKANSSFSYSNSKCVVKKKKKCVVKQRRKHNINNAFGPGTANNCTVLWWFKKFCKGDKSLEDEEYGCRPLEVDNN